METINCRHVGPSGTTCRRVAYNRLYYCKAHRDLYPDAESRANVLTPPETEQTDTISEPSKPAESEEESEPTDWDEVQEEGGWWDAALPEATPEERKKEAIANAEVAERSLKAEEIYTVASLGGEVTDEVFGKDLSGSIIAKATGAVGFVLLLPFVPVLLAGALGGRGGEIGFPIAVPLIEALWTPPIFAVAILFGSLVGFSDFRKRTEALARGYADLGEAAESGEDLT